MAIKVTLKFWFVSCLSGKILWVLKNIRKYKLSGSLKVSYHVSLFYKKKFSWGVFWEGSYSSWIDGPLRCPGCLQIFTVWINALGEVIHLHFVCLFHLGQTLGLFVLPNAVCGQSHFLPLQHLSLSHCLSFLMNINKGDALFAVCHVWRGACSSGYL